MSNDIGAPIECPVDYALFQFPDEHVTGDTAHAMLELAEAGLIRIFDITALRKDADGAISGFELSAFPGDEVSFASFTGAQSGLLGDDDVAAAGEMLDPGTLAVLVVYENAWATPFVAAADRAGAGLISGGRILPDDIVQTLDALDVASAS